MTDGGRKLAFGIVSTVTLFLCLITFLNIHYEPEMQTHASKPSGWGGILGADRNGSDIDDDEIITRRPDESEFNATVKLDDYNVTTTFPSTATTEEFSRMKTTTFQDAAEVDFGKQGQESHEQEQEQQETQEGQEQEQEPETQDQGQEGQEQEQEQEQETQEQEGQEQELETQEQEGQESYEQEQEEEQEYPDLTPTTTLSSFWIGTYGPIYGARFIQELKDDTFYDFLDNHEVIFIMFYTTWCGHSQRAKVEFAAAAEQMTTIQFASIDCDLVEWSCNEGNVTGYPTFNLYKFGEFENKYTGSKREVGFVKYLTKVEQGFLF